MGIFDFWKKSGVEATTNVAEATQVNEQENPSETEEQPRQENAEQPKAEAQKQENAEQSKDEAQKQENAEQSQGEAQQQQPRGKAHIYNLIILDESGSMISLAESTLSGLNETIGTIRQAQKEFAETQEHFLTLVTFDSPGRDRVPIRTIIDTKPIAEVADVTDYHPCGCTPLYDAMGQSITTLYEKIKNDPDASAMVTVLTDGLENASHEYRGRQVKKLIERLKAEGWTFSYMGSAHDVRSVTDLLSIDHVTEFAHDNTGARNTWKRETSAKHNLFQMLNDGWEGVSCFSASEKKEHFSRMSRSYYRNRITPDHITVLQPNEVFVFGSSLDGSHSGGAARYAVEHFGAVVGQGSGLQGQSYAIPTTVRLSELILYVQEFTQFAAQHPELTFYVTAVGCGTAGYSVAQVAPLFEDCINLENVCLPREFWDVLGVRVDSGI